MINCSIGINFYIIFYYNVVNMSDFFIVIIFLGYKIKFIVIDYSIGMDDYLIINYSIGINFDFGI